MRLIKGQQFKVKKMRIAVFVFLLSSTLATTVHAQFVHPGVAHDSQSIAFAKEKVAAGEQPWANAWEKFRDSSFASLDWKPNASANVERGPYNHPDFGSSEFSDDGWAAYCHAICWTMTGDEAHAEKAAEILNAWSSTLRSIKNHDAALLVGMSGYHYCVAGELIKHTWDKWPQDEQARFAAMQRDIFYPIIKDFYATANGNWDASMMQVMIAMGVFLDDQKMFDQATEYFLQGRGNGAIGNYFMASGQCQESGRDQAHTQMGLDFLANTCETAWIQGVDLYGALDNRLLKGFEYTAKYNLGFDVPYEAYESVEGRYLYERLSKNSRGRLRPMYEQVYNHYHNRKGLEAKYTGLAADKLRSKEDRRRGRRRRSSRKSKSGAQLETLLYAGEPEVEATPKAKEPAAVKASSDVERVLEPVGS